MSLFDHQLQYCYFALIGGQEDISWEEFHTEQYAFLEESHITVRITDHKILDHILKIAFSSQTNPITLKVNSAQTDFSFIQAKMSQENLDAYKDLVERYIVAIS